MTGRRLAARNERVSWQVAPAEYEIANYDAPKFKYRKYVETFIRQLTKKSILKRSFFTISTNVLCADIQSSKETVEPVDRDLYLPLEIAITKWSLTDGKKDEHHRVLTTKLWMINPGPPTRNSNSYALDHRKKHKITFDGGDDWQNSHIERDMIKVMKDINAFLNSDRTVFSLGLKHVRQDLGALKWINRESGYKSKPISVFSIEDLYVVLVRSFNPSMVPSIGQGIANHRLDSISNAYNSSLQCEYHRAKAKEPDGECRYCAKALSQGWSLVIINDVVKFGKVFDDPAAGPSPASSPPKLVPISPP